jgi:Flp pilus assembly protein TadG
MVLPVLLAVVLFGLWLVGMVVAHIRCGDAARDVARAVARGEPFDAAQQLGRRTAPSEAEITVARDGSDVHVVVSSIVSPDWPLLRRLPPFPVNAEAIIQAEPGTTGDLP